MLTAKIFKIGQSQVVCLKECRFEGYEVSVNKIGSIVILMPNTDKWDGLRQSLNFFTEDFMAEGRADNIKQERETL